MLNKFIFSDNGTLSDKTLIFTDYNLDSMTLAMVTAEDTLYIGSKYPFTRKFFKVGTANVVAGVATVKYWDGSTWRTAVNTTDGTSPSGTPLARSGYLSWEADKRYPWTRSDTSLITGLTTATVYDMYWVALTYSATISAIVPWIGECFCTETEFAAEFPDLARATVLDGFQSGKTDWEAQRVVASQLVSQDLIRTWKPDGAQSVLGADQLTFMTVQKTAEIVFRGLGQGYADSAKDAREEYDRRKGKEVLISDDNANGRADVADLKPSRVTRLYR